MGLEDEVVGALIGFVGAVLGALISGLITWRVAKDQIKVANEQIETERASAEKARIYTALHHFTGGTQNRNVGIAVIEQSWTAMPDTKALVRPLLVNQAIYLLTNSKEVNDLHERDNLKRIMSLVLDGNTDPDVRRFYPDLREAVRGRLDDIPGNQTKRTHDPKLRGVEVEKEMLETWQEALGVD
jgi:hypothetical protein